MPPGHRAHGGPARPQSIQPAPTANLDRTDDTVYSNVMDLVRAVLQLKNEISLLPPEGYILVVKVGRGGGDDLSTGEGAGSLCTECCCCMGRLPRVLPSWEGLTCMGGSVSSMSCSSVGSLGHWWDYSQHVLLHWVLGSMEGAFPIRPAPPLCRWVNDGNVSNILCSSIASLGQWGEFPTYSAPPLGPCVNGGSVSNTPHSSVVSLGQWWDHFLHVLLLHWVLGSMMGMLPPSSAPPLAPWDNRECFQHAPLLH